MMIRLRMRAPARLRTDSGSTMVTVLIIMLVLTLGGLTLAAVTANTTGSLVMTRDHSVAQAEVDGAIATQSVALREGDLLCDTSQQQSGSLRNGSSSYPVSWTLDCSVSGDMGTATLKARSNVEGVQALREAIFSYTVAPSEGKVNSALITKAPLDLASLKIKAVDSKFPADVWVIPDPGEAGNFRCDSGGAIAGSVYLPEGTVFGAGGCEVSGDIFSQKDISIGRGTKVGGDLVSLEGNVTISGGVTITGSIFAQKSVTGSGLSEEFVQNIHAVENLSLLGGAPSARGDITYGGSFNPPPPAKRFWAKGTVTNKTVSPPAIPPAAEWQGISQADLDGLVSDGLFEMIPWTGSCTHVWYPLPEMLTKIQNLTNPTIIDARHCSRVDIPGRGADSATLKLKTDVVFLAPSFNMQAMNFASADGNEHRVWMISPEETNRDCSSVAPVNLQGVKMLPVGNSKITGLVFTQCTVHFANASEDWQGSIQAGKLTGKPNFWYKPIAFPGQADPNQDGSEAGGSNGRHHLPGSFRLEKTQDLPIP